MIQTTADNGVGARLGANEAQIYAAGPIVTYSFGDPKDPLTFVAKYFRGSALSGRSRAMWLT